MASNAPRVPDAFSRTTTPIGSSGLPYVTPSRRLARVDVAQLLQRQAEHGVRLVDGRGDHVDNDSEYPDIPRLFLGQIARRHAGHDHVGDHRIGGARRQSNLVMSRRTVRADERFHRDLLAPIASGDRLGRFRQAMNRLDQQARRDQAHRQDQRHRQQRAKLPPGQTDDTDRCNIYPLLALMCHVKTRPPCRKRIPLDTRRG